LDALILHNGTLLNKNDLSISLLENRGFLYGDGLFETIKILNGAPFHLNQHLSRLSKGAEALKLHINISAIKNNVFTLLKANKIDGFGSIKINVFRTKGGKYTPHSNTGESILSFTKSDHGYLLNNQGMTIGLFKESPIKIALFSSFKSLNCMPYILGGIYTKSKHLDQCIMINEKGAICEGNNSNIFFVKGKTIYTPHLSSGCLEGIMRKIIISLAKKNNYTITETTIWPSEINSFDEIFFTNVIDGIKWTIAYDKKRYINKTSKHLIDILNEQISKNMLTKHLA